MKMRTLISISQVISFLGSELTLFALPIWIYQQKGSVLSLSTMMIVAILPKFLFGPIAGALVDKLPKKKVLFLSDAAQALASLFLFSCVAFDLPMPFIYTALLVSGTAGVFQVPALQTIIRDLSGNNRSSLTKANGWLSMAESIGGIVAPVIAAPLLLNIGLKGVILVDLCTFLISSVILSLLHYSEPTLPTRKTSFVGMVTDVRSAFLGVLRERRLFQLLNYTCVLNFGLSFAWVLLVPMVLGDKNNVLLLSLVTSIGSIANLGGGFTVTNIRAPKKTAEALYALGFFLGAFGLCVIGITRLPYVWISGVAVVMFLIPFTNAYNRTVWCELVPRENLGTMIALRRSFSSLASITGYFLSGLLFDQAKAVYLSDTTNLSRYFFIAGGTMIAVVSLLRLLSSGIQTKGACCNELT